MKMEKDDLKNASSCIYFILTGIEKASIIEDRDLDLIPIIELRVLILALQLGLRAEDALKSPVFYTIGDKLETINKLNEMVKAVEASNREKELKGEPMDQTVFDDLEENHELMKGNHSSWFNDLSLHLQVTYGLFGHGYNIASA